MPAIQRAAKRGAGAAVSAMAPMASCDYAAIRADNKLRYGSEVGRYGPMLLADRYDDRTHFIFELLQNAEDALARRPGWEGPRSVRFRLAGGELRVSHFGKPFDAPDVRGVCGIAESTKELTAIGRFGIGFKSVYAFTDRPRIHSGAEDFAIECFVWPTAALPIERSADETIIAIPLKSDDPAEREEITTGLRRLGARALLFLRQIEEIDWAIDDGPSGFYLRSRPDVLDDGVRRITLLGSTKGESDLEETWLVFSKPVSTSEGVSAGYVELAFRVEHDEKAGRERIAPVSQSPLVVFFPTVLETHLGFLIQGPYRTTPSRDNVPRHDRWNQQCVQESTRVLADALLWLRNHDLLGTGALRCLPLDREKFGGDSMFAPLFDATKRLLAAEPLLPRFGGGYIPARRARLARTQELRELFDAVQLAALFDADEALDWLSGDVSQDRTPELRQYMMRELEIVEVTPESIMPRLEAAFLEAQSDEWILRLYEFLNGQPALRYRLATVPLIRLTDGRHVPPRTDDVMSAFLPGLVDTDFPTVRTGVCCSEGALAFLRSLGLTDPDPVDDVIWNVLPKYRAEAVDNDHSAYEADIRRILAAYASDSKGQREKLTDALRKTKFVMAVDSGDAQKYVAKPDKIYIATDRLTELFASVSGVLRVDDEYACLRGEDVRELLEACGALRYPRPVEDASLSWQERQDLRMQAGHAQTSGYNDRVTDWSLLGLQELLKTLSESTAEECRAKAKLLWEELGHLEERRGKGVFTGEYTWTHHGRYQISFDSAFVRLLNEAEWVPDPQGGLQPPSLVLFDSLGWKPNPFLLSKIRFKPPIIDQLAKEAGIEPGVLDLLKKLGVTSEAELRSRLGVGDELPQAEAEPGGGSADVVENPLGEAPDSMPPAPDPSSVDPAPIEGGSGGGQGGGGQGGGDSSGSGAGRADGGAGREPGGGGAGRTGEKQTSGSSSQRSFISYVAVHPDEEEPDPDGLDQSARMRLEARAIDHILVREPDWQRTPAFNPGFDLFVPGPVGRPCRWCEVKAMTGSLDHRPVGLSRTQFDCARERGEDYWLYVVEHAGDENPRIVRIQDPAGKACTFTFDRGWLHMADADPGVEDHDGRGDQST